MGVARLLEVVTVVGMVVGTYFYLEGVQASMDRLERELLGIAEAERIRDDEWEHDDELRVANQDRTLGLLVSGHDAMSSRLEALTALTEAMHHDARESFLQRENRFEELELGQRENLTATKDLQLVLGQILELARQVAEGG